MDLPIMNDAALPALIAAFPEPVLLLDRAGTVLVANPAATDLLGARITGAQLRAHLRQPSVLALLDTVLSGGEAENAQYIATSGTRETTWDVTARRMGGGRIIVTLRDVSDIVVAEAQRRDFVANVSHELRSPLTVLAGFIETLQGAAGNDAATRQEFLSIMAQQAERMTGLVADLLSLSRVEAVEKVRPRTPVSIEMVLKATLAALRPQIESAALHVDLRLPDGLPDVPGDYDQLVQVYHNLIENALHYGASGGRIEVQAQVMGTMPGMDGPVLRVSVRDFGAGIDPIYIPRLTERFYRVDPARSRDSGGTGLGLAIVKHIVGRHRGRLVITSALGQGASFETILPCT